MIAQVPLSWMQAPNVRICAWKHRAWGEKAIEKGVASRWLVPRLFGVW